MVKSEAIAASAPVQGIATPDNEPKKAVADTTGPQGDAVAGRQVFKKCQACHSLEPGKTVLGPSLSGIVGRKSGAEPDFNYSPAMKQAALTWDAATLDAYLMDPQKIVPGNRMPFPGLKTDQDRKDLIAFLAAPASPAGASTSKAAAPAASATATPQTKPGSDPVYLTDAKYTLRTGIAEGKMVFLGVGGSIDGKANPVLTAAEGQIVQLTLINGEGTEHDIVFPDQGAKSPRVNGKGASTTIVFRATKSGDFIYFCSVPGHQLAGMQGQFLVTPILAPQTLVEADISRDPTDLPPPIGKRDPTTVRLDLFTAEQEGRLAEATTFGYWTFNGKVPGPFVRVRVGDTVDVHLKNSADSNMIHSVDFHAATGPGGGAAALQVDPGAEKSMTFKALIPGLYVYHCATPMVAEHIANGMYGMILVEPEAGLSPVDHEFYVMQGEIYTEAAFGQHGSQEFSVEKLLNERPEYFVFNGSVGAISKLHPLHAKVGETVRLFFGVGGPNFTSSFHVIGEIFDKVYNLGGLTNPPLEGIQTVTVAPGGAVITEFKLHVPGNYTIVDHALARMERGLVGLLIVEGTPNPDIYNGTVMPGMGH
ncbi:copper-containing nitrite reductase [Bradyrhizobium sp.]|uniref:copper-containing nitrite reductase n=1 Tax=Bradyrhizobium sp. TaxID=376 RepID=UPI003C6F4AA9